MQSEQTDADSRARPTAIVFDLGGVLIDWSPHYLYRSLLPDDEAIDAFLAEIGFREWNHSLDHGRDWDEAVDWLSHKYPSRAALIEAYRDRWEESLGQPIDPVVAILADVRTTAIPLYALSNWSKRTFAVAQKRFWFLEWFDGIVISGEVGVAKPDPGIFRHLLTTFDLEPRRTLFIDDTQANVDTAISLGIQALRMTSADSLRSSLIALGVLGDH